MTHTNTEALSDAVTREDAIKFLEGACRNWSKVPRLSEEDIGDVASELLRFALSRRSASNTGGVEVKARQALAVYGEWAVDVATLGELGDLEARMTAVGLTLQDVGKWSNPPSLAAEAEPVAQGSCASCNGTGDTGGNPSYGMCPDCDGTGKFPPAHPSSSVSAEVTEAEWYLDPNDPADGHNEIYEIIDSYGPGKPIKVHHAAVVKETFHVWLPAADDADSDDNWEFSAPTEAECLRALADETERRASINGGRENG